MHLAMSLLLGMLKEQTYFVRAPDYVKIVCTHSEIYSRKCPGYIYNFTIMCNFSNKTYESFAL